MTEAVVPVAEVRRLLHLYGRDIGSQARWAFERICERAQETADSRAAEPTVAKGPSGLLEEER